MQDRPSNFSAPAETRSAPASTPEKPTVWRDTSGRALVRCCSGVDVPGAGWQHSFDCPETRHPVAVLPGTEYVAGKVPPTLHNYLQNEPLFDLITSARRLAEANIRKNIDANEAEYEHCIECGFSQRAYHFKLRHEKGCQTGKVLHLAEFFEEALQPNPTEVRKEAAPEPVPSASDGVRSRGSFGEPWKWIGTPSGEVWVADRAETIIARTVSGSPRESRDWAERIVACVNFCSGFSTEELIRVATDKKGGQL